MLVISEPSVIKTSLISLPIGNCDICVFNTLQGGLLQRGGKATGKHPFLIITLVMRGWLHPTPLKCFEEDISTVVETSCSKYPGVACRVSVGQAIVCLPEHLRRPAGRVFSLLTCRQTLQLCSELESRLWRYKKLFHPVEQPGVKLAKPSWLILQSLDDTWCKSTSIRFTQRKRALMQSALLYYDYPGWGPSSEPLLKGPQRREKQKKN